MNYHPVIIPTLNRYTHFRNCVESLSLCTHAEKTELIIGLDYPPTDKYVDGWKRIKEYFPIIKGFKNVTVIERNHNFGAVQNFQDLQSYTLKYNDAYISTEDDNVFSPCFLDYMNQCLDKYKDDKSISAICGYLQPLEWEQKPTNSTIVKLNGCLCAWGLGTWKDRVDEFSKHIPRNYRNYIFNNKQYLIKLKEKVRQLNHIMYWLDNPVLDYACDFTIEAYMVIHNKSAVFPIQSLVRNMGYDGTGVNCGLPSKEVHDMYTYQEICTKRVYPIIDNFTNTEIENYTHQFEIFMIGKDFSDKEIQNTIKKASKYLYWGYENCLKFNKLKLKTKTKIKKLLKPLLNKLRRL